jgi:energy-coupling factor transporter ATP-binding protein EcfA2
MIGIDNLTFTYGADDCAILKRVNLSIKAGEFLLLAGPTGSGKSTLFKTLIGLAPHFTGGTLKGSFEIGGTNVAGSKPHELAHLVAYVNQQPEGAFATDTVEEELAYGMEQLGYSPAIMIDRVTWVADTLGLEALMKRPLDSLSGGQQQRVAIGAAIAAGQKILLLDEPTSALDEAGARSVLELLTDLAGIHGFTVILSEHRTDRVLPYVDGVIALGLDGSLSKMPVDDFASTERDLATRANPRGTAEVVKLMTAIGLSQSYSGVEVLHPIDLTIKSGIITAITGENGSGKTSLLWCLLREAWRQSVPVSMVPQNAADLLYSATIAEEFDEARESTHGSTFSAPELLERLVGRIDPSTHPRDLSAGQQLALTTSLQLSQGARLVILDEPTRGLDRRAMAALDDTLDFICQQGASVVLATHDLEFADAVSDYQIALRDGRRADED